MKIMRLMLVLCWAQLHAQLDKPELSKQELLQQFAQPIIFTRANIQTFLTDVFNHQMYGTYCLPSNFMHIADFLAHSPQVDNPREFSLSVFNLFHSRLKESYWVNPYALAQILEVINRQCAPLCQKQGNNFLRNAVKKSLYNAMLSRFHELKKDPEFFMTSLADEILELVEHTEQESIMELQHTITRFIEGALDKIIWDPREQESCWESCKLIAEQLHSLHQNRIIRTESSLNHCYWSLIYRFSYFLETTGEHLKPETYDLIKHDLVARTCSCLTLEEQEEFIASKVRRLQRAVIEGEVKARSAAAGFLLQ